MAEEIGVQGGGGALAIGANTHPGDLRKTMLHYNVSGSRSRLESKRKNESR